MKNTSDLLQQVCLLALTDAIKSIWNKRQTEAQEAEIEASIEFSSGLVAICGQADWLQQEILCCGYFVESIMNFISESDIELKQVS